MDSYVQKIHKHLDAIKAKNEKLTEENRQLKDTIKELKSVNSRVRRLPKKSATPASEDAPPAPPAQ